MLAAVTSWETFAVISGGAAAGLTGLLFVAVSIRVDVIAASRELRNRAGQTLVLFVTVLFIGLLLSIPEQAYLALGLELLALDAVAGGFLLLLDRRAGDDAGERPTAPAAVARTLNTYSPNTITAVLLAVAAGLLIAELHAGLFVLVLPIVAALAGGVVSAWLLLTKTAA
jgi:hypothetical protein